MRLITILVGMIVALLGLAAPTEASLILAGTIGGVNFCAADNNIACGFGLQLTDTDGAAGSLQLANVLIGGLQVNGSLQTQQVATTPGSFNILNTSSLSIINNSGADVSATVAIGATNYAGPALQARAAGAGTWQGTPGSVISLTWYNDPLNTQGAETPADRPGTLLFSGTDTADFDAEAFAFNSGLLAVNDPALFGMTLGIDLTLKNGGSLINRGQTELKPLVPEPATLLLLGTGLVAGARYRRRHAHGDQG